eukprot:CAMPEP_0170155100 /NCGR_PEP_ID=MMETSP0033_2-20121228/59775_1 /TAXON_ID=195969 /ORGANISM="Dolichomastix tenuilepis, Strain CCMP3274" /LENGTH=34 /DNA_ID= /DNA_START= /DNA_END= /DNA_ORIENTATION=
MRQILSVDSCKAVEDGCTHHQNCLAQLKADRARR